jgi:enoyl-CoA hydratase/carnithine racemase
MSTPQPSETQQDSIVIEPPVLFEEQPAGPFRIGVATLNRPRQLNAINLEMCQLLLDRFRAWQSDDGVVAVVLRGAGDKGFSAGGDVADLVRRVRAGGPDRFVYGDAFFAVEYSLNLLIHHYRKPLLSLSHGINMGGGVGLTVGASHRVVSDRSRVAMPEIHIGLIPDVGGGFFLNRVPCGIGTVMALTGLTLNETDTVFTGLADWVLPRATFDELLDALRILPWSGQAGHDNALLTRLLQAQSQNTAPSLPRSELLPRLDALRAISVCPTALDMRDALQAAAAADPWFKPWADSLSRGSPTAAYLTLEYLRRAKTLSLAQVLDMDLRVTCACQRAHDFPEGVRALLIDKDRAPQWSPANFEAVDPMAVAAHFVG